MFHELMRDKIKIIKKNGEDINNLNAYVSKNTIMLMDSDISIDSNDRIQRFMPNGEIENFQVLDAGFSKGMFNIPPHYNISIKKLDLPEIKITKKSKISISNKILNIRSIETSIKNINGNPYVDRQIKALINAIDNTKLSFEEKKKDLRTVDEISKNLKSNNPCEDVIESLFNSLPHERNILSIRSFLIGCFKS
jgi:hypothetical protein